MWSRYVLTGSDVSTKANDVFEKPGLSILYGCYHFPPGARKKRYKRLRATFKMCVLSVLLMMYGWNFRFTWSDFDVPPGTKRHYTKKF